MLGAPGADLVGQLIANRYRIERILGQGGQGVVCKALDEQEARQVALKLLAPDGARDPQRAGRFIREQESLKALDGTSAVRVYDTGKADDGSLFLVLELLDGRDLEQELQALEDRGDRMTLERIAEIMVPVAATLEAAHEKGIIHRDLKPANIYLLSSGGIRLLDFGFARVGSSKPLTEAGFIMGSPSYIAPEAWHGRRELSDHRQDVYSLAVVLFRMLGGKAPFQADSMRELHQLVTTAPRPPLTALRADLPAEVDSWTQCALAVERDERFRSASACLGALFVSLGRPELVPAELLRAGARSEAPPASTAERMLEALQEAATALWRWPGRD